MPIQPGTPIRDPGNAGTASEWPDPHLVDTNPTPRRDPTSLLAAIATSIALLVIVIGWMSTRDYAWAVYGATTWLALMITVMGISAYLNPRPRPNRKPERHQ